MFTLIGEGKLIILALFEHPLALEEAINNLVRLELLGQFRVVSHQPSQGCEPRLILPEHSISTGVDSQTENPTSEASYPALINLQDFELELSGHFSAEQLHHAMERVSEGKPALLLWAPTQGITQLLSEYGAIEVITGG